MRPAITRPSPLLFCTALAILVAGTALVSIRNLPSLAPPAQESRAYRLLECPVDTIDFGRVFRPATPITYEFPIRNKSDHPVSLSVARRSCTCAMATLAAETLASGESTVLKVEWKVPDRVGREGFKVNVTVTDSDSTEHDLVCSGRVRVSDLLRAEPEELALGAVKPDEKKIGRILLFPSPGEPLPDELILKQVDPPAPELTVRGRRRPDNSYEIQVTVVGKPELAVRPAEYRIPIHTGDPLQPEMIVLVKAEHQDWYVPSPASVLLTHQAKGLPRRQVFVDRLDGKLEPITVDRLENDNPDVIGTEHRIDEKGRLEVGLQLLQSLEGHIAGKIRVYINGSSHPVSIGYMAVGK